MANEENGRRHRRRFRDYERHHAPPPIEIEGESFADRSTRLAQRLGRGSHRFGVPDRDLDGFAKSIVVLQEEGFLSDRSRQLANSLMSDSLRRSRAETAQALRESIMQDAEIMKRH
jgi:hypothetical protein